MLNSGSEAQPATLSTPPHAVRNVRLYLAGLTASTLGDSALSLVAGIWVKELTGSSAAAALVAVCIYAPSLLGPLAGLLADRVRRRRLLMVTELAAGAAVLSLLLVSDRSWVWLIYAVMALYGLSLVITDAAESALFAVMLPTEVRAGVNGLRLTLTEGCKLLAPLIGAGLYALAGGGTVAALDAGTFVVAALSVSLLRFDEPKPVRDPARGRWWAEAAEGFAHLWRVRELRVVCGAAAVAMYASGIAVAAQYSLVSALHHRPSFLGVLVSLLGLGSILAGLTSGWVVRRRGERWLVGLGLANGAAWYLLGATAWLPTVLAGRLVAGFALPWVVVGTATLVQRLTPDHLQGRAAAATTLLLFGPQPVAQALGALAISVLDFRLVYVGMAGAGLAALAVLVRSQR
ncbi:MAG: MFS transporter [Mycobacteriales bacterium]